MCDFFILSFGKNFFGGRPCPFFPTMTCFLILSFGKNFFGGRPCPFFPTMTCFLILSLAATFLALTAIFLSPLLTPDTNLPHQALVFLAVVLIFFWTILNQALAFELAFLPFILSFAATFLIQTLAALPPFLRTVLTFFKSLPIFFLRLTL